MTRNYSVKLKHPIIVALALFLSSLVFGVLFGLETILSATAEILNGSSFGHTQLSYFLPSALFASFVSIIFSLILFLPIIFFFKKITWLLPGVWSVVFFGFLFCAVPTFIVFLTPIEGKLSEAIGNYKDGYPTLKGVALALRNAFLIGVAGAGYGLVFWIFAVNASFGEKSETEK